MCLPGVPPMCVPTGFSRLCRDRPVSCSRTNVPQLHKNSGTLNSKFACPRHSKEEAFFGRRIYAVPSETIDRTVGPEIIQAISMHNFRSFGEYGRMMTSGHGVTGCLHERSISRGRIWLV